MNGKRLHWGEISGGPVANYTLYTTGGTHRFGGTVNIASGALQLAGTQVVTTRQTGYTAMTGTANRGTSYDTSTITLVQLATRVKALQEDLIHTRTDRHMTAKPPKTRTWVLTKQHWALFEDALRQQQAGQLRLNDVMQSIAAAFGVEL